MWQLQRTHSWLNLGQPSRLVHTTRDQKLWTRSVEEFWFLGVGGNWSARRKPTKAGVESLNQIQSYQSIISIFISIPKQTSKSESNKKVHVWYSKVVHTLYNHWLAALVKGKCSSAKWTHLAIGVVCHPDTEQNRPTKFPALLGIEPGTYWTASETSTIVPHYSTFCRC